MQKKRLFLAIALIQFTFIAGSQANTQPRLMGAYDAWEAYSFTENGQKVCYMATQPGNKEGDYTKRGDPFALITHRPAENSRNVFSYITGYDYKPGSAVTVFIDDQKFMLFTKGNTAWAPDAQNDNQIVEAIKKGSGMKIVGTSSRGTTTTDTLSLKGSGKAYERISQECR
ncbi:MAG: hypothetical protein IT559_08690 [Alphaproteobacteria bacterium]|nr:hypothetical protein [Alphaproteobacteria bacterium]